MVEVKLTKDFKRDFERYRNYIKTIYNVDIFYVNADGTTSLPEVVQAVKPKDITHLTLEDISNIVVEFMHEDSPHLRKHKNLSARSWIVTGKLVVPSAFT